VHISSAGLRLIEGFEGWSSAPYWDSYGGVWTRGYGETEGIGPHSPWLSRAQGEANLKRLVETRYEWAINRLGVPLNQNQFDALCSFVWNLGAGIFAGHLGDLLRGRNFQGFADAMLAYDHAGGVQLAGLTRRRHEERALFLHPGAPAGPVDWRPPEEWRWEHEYDHLLRSRGPWAAMRRRVLRRVMARRREEIWRLAESEQPDGWGKRNRKKRYVALRSRTEGQHG
jgi:lysozyme